MADRPDPEPDDEDVERGESISDQVRRRSSRSRSSQRPEGDQTSETTETDQTTGSSKASGASESSDSDTDTDSSQMSKTDQTTEATDSDETTETTVKEKTHVAMYLDEDLAEALDTRFTELNLEYKKQYGESIEKSRDLYPAMARAAINNTTVKEELDLDD